MRLRVALRYLEARSQLAPALDLAEKFARDEKWDETVAALDALGKMIGVFFLHSSGRQSIRTEWFHGLDSEDKDRFIGFAQILSNIHYEAWAMGHVRGYPREKLERVPALFDRAREDLPWVQDLMRDDSDAFIHGPFKIIPLKGVTDTAEAVATLDKAATLVNRHFSNVLYGKVYIRKDLRPSGTYDPRPGSSGLIAGSYVAATDTITLSMYARPERDSVMTLIHELGHRYHTRFLKGEKRDKFIQLSTTGEVLTFSPAERQKAADEYMALFTLHQREEYPDDTSKHLSERARMYMNAMPREIARRHVSLLQRFRDEKDDSVRQALHDAIAMKNVPGAVEFPANPHSTEGLAASEYGRTSWEENFAEAFLAFVLGKPLPAALQTFMASL